VPIHAITKVLKHKGRDHDLLKVYVPSDRTPSELVKRLKALLGSTRPLKCQAAPADPKKDRYRPVNRRHMLARAH
jgi:hypothetical protein